MQGIRLPKIGSILVPRDEYNPDWHDIPEYVIARVRVLQDKKKVANCGHYGSHHMRGMNKLCGDCCRGFDRISNLVDICYVPGVLYADNDYVVMVSRNNKAKLYKAKSIFPVYPSGERLVFECDVCERSIGVGIHVTGSVVCTGCHKFVNNAFKIMAKKYYVLKKYLPMDVIRIIVNLIAIIGFPKRRV